MANDTKLSDDSNEPFPYCSVHCTPKLVAYPDQYPNEALNFPITEVLLSRI